MQRKNLSYIIAGGLASIAFVLFFIFVYLPMGASKNETDKFRESLRHSAKLSMDPVHKVPAFSFTDQNGNVFDNNSVKGKVYVADFFFASCQAICPRLSTQLSRVQEEIGVEEDFRIVSHTLHPEHDTLEVLKEYGAKYGSNDSVWYFLWGPKEEVVSTGENGYLQTVINNGSIFDHSQKFVLVDRKGMIRGFYNGVDTLDVNLMIMDIKFLMYREN